MKMILLLVSCCFLSCRNPMYTKDNEVKKTPPVSYTYLALGDSYTKGESVDESESFPVQLAALLSKERDINSIQSKIIAQTGWTTTSLLNNLTNQHVGNNYCLVTLLIGVNNQYQGLSLIAYRKEFEQCLQKAIACANGEPDRVVVLSIPDYGRTPFGSSNKEQISSELDLFNAINKTVADSMKISYVFITDISRRNDAAMVAPDGLHPSGAQYRLWVQRMYPLVLKKIRSN